jgi:hypothetical protein
MAGGNIFDTFEEEHKVTPTLPQYNTRARTQHHSDNNAQHHVPRILHPITFRNTQVYHAPSQQAINHITTANAVINQDTGASLEYL